MDGFAGTPQTEAGRIVDAFLMKAGLKAGAGITATIMSEGGSGVHVAWEGPLPQAPAMKMRQSRILDFTTHAQAMEAVQKLTTPAPAPIAFTPA